MSKDIMIDGKQAGVEELLQGVAAAVQHADAVQDAGVDSDAGSVMDASTISSVSETGAPAVVTDNRTHPDILSADFTEIRKRVAEIIDKLPQRDLIDEGDRRGWMEAVISRFPKQAGWHATRAGGFGGSQIGELVRNHNGVRGDHSSAHDIVEGNLLRRLPEPPTAAMLRGVGVEEWHRAWFLGKRNAERDHQLFDLLSKSQGQFQWMRYSPDELCRFPVGAFPVLRELQPGEDPRPIVLGDYKAPTEVDMREAVSFQYICQLHMGRLVLQEKGIPVDGMVLSQFNWKDWKLKDDIISHDPQIDEMILTAGNHYWNDYVMQGKVPDYVRKERLEQELEQNLKDRFSNAGFAYATLKSLAGALEAQADKINSEMKEAMAPLRFDNAKLLLTGVSVSASPVFDNEAVRGLLGDEVFDSLPLKGNSTRRYDVDALVKAYKELGGDARQFQLPANVDSIKLYEALIDHGHDADGLVSESLRFMVNKQVKEQAVEWVGKEFAPFINYAELSDADDGSDEDGQNEVERERPAG